eukprot:TRINITY_DN4137_c0_g3_i2.p1 TRINITY_DN4137_c0_g3~~TRINITY_DN4137_c0_g3_i2.p1  ORF type:complete len:148 (+),score=34.27 TRINITY_DN4137_c0_g3_i2:73-516(+)
MCIRDRFNSHSREINELSLDCRQIIGYPNIRRNPYFFFSHQTSNTQSDTPLPTTDHLLIPTSRQLLKRSIQTEAEELLYPNFGGQVAVLGTKQCKERVLFGYVEEEKKGAVSVVAMPGWKEEVWSKERVEVVQIVFALESVLLCECV